METKSEENKLFRIFGSMDSVRNAHPISSSVSLDNWWQARNPKDWESNIATAQAQVLRQVLLGDVIVLPRNLFLDSPAWFHMADYLVKLKRLPTFYIAIYDPDEKLSLSPHLFFEDIARIFESSFAFSAWPGLDSDQRKTIAGNIRKNDTLGFRKMFADVTIDSSLKPVFEYQADIFQAVRTYLTQHPTAIIRSGSPNTSMWEKICEIKKGLSHQPGYTNVINALDEMGMYSKDLPNPNDWLNRRGDLYRFLFRYDDDTRYKTRLIIDDCYYNTLSESCCGQTNYTRLDQSGSGLPHEQRDAASDVVGSLSGPRDGLMDEDAIFKDSEDRNDFLEGIIDQLNNDKVLTDSILDLRNRRVKGKSREYQKDVMDSHVDLLCKRIPWLIAQDSPKGKIISSLMDNGVTLVLTFLTFNLDIPIEIKVVSPLLIKFGINFFINKLSGKLDDAVKEKQKTLVDHLLKDEINTVTGKLRLLLKTES